MWTVLCSGIEALVSLRRLDLGNNRIRRWDEVQRLAQLPQLEKLWLEGNPVADIVAYRIKASATETSCAVLVAASRAT
jgi:Leucine-rich repeat (LRR) protein